MPGNGQRGFSRSGGSVTTGTILAQDAKSITVKTADGGSKTVFFSANTRYTQQQELTAADLKVGDRGDGGRAADERRHRRAVDHGGPAGFGVPLRRAGQAERAGPRPGYGV